MRRSDRLAAIIDIFRDCRLHRAADIAERLDVSIRTIYRDVDTLIDSGFPIDGERGVGYMLREPIILPPMNLSTSELEALHLGMAIVEEVADRELQQAAQSLIEKLGRVAPPGQTMPSRWSFGIYPFEQIKLGFPHMPLIREAIREQMLLCIEYCSLAGVNSGRVVRPLQIEYWGQAWTLTAWCELRTDFRVFRIDRIKKCEATGETFKNEHEKSLTRYLGMMPTSEKSDEQKHRSK